jgi:hypothetical protein
MMMSLRITLLLAAFFCGSDYYPDKLKITNSILWL